MMLKGFKHCLKVLSSNIFLNVWGETITLQKKIEFGEINDNALFFKSILGFIKFAKDLYGGAICPM